MTATIAESSPSTPTTELDTYYDPAFIKTLQPTIPYLKTLRLRFKDFPPDPDILHWIDLSTLLIAKLPHLEKLYIYNEINMHRKPHEPCFGTHWEIPVENGGWRKEFNFQPLKSLKVLHVPFETVALMRSIPVRMPYGLEELVIDIKGHVGGFANGNWMIINQCIDIRLVQTYFPRCKIIWLEGWAIGIREEREFKEGRMTEEAYHERIAADLIEEHNAGMFV